MPATTYDVSARGHKCTIPVEVAGASVGGRLMLRKATESTAKALSEVTLAFEAIDADSTGTRGGERISIRINDHRIGHLSEGATRDYAQLKRIVASGVEPVSVARIRAAQSGGSPVYDVSLSLRPAEEVVPLNAPPGAPWALLPPGNILQVTKEDEHAAFLGSILPEAGRAQVLVTLHRETFGVRKKFDGVEVRIDGTRVGELSKAMGEKMLPAVDHFTALGLVCVSRGFITGSTTASEVTLECARAADLTDADLEPEVSPLPPLVEYRRDATSYGVNGDQTSPTSEAKASSATSGSARIPSAATSASAPAAPAIPSAATSRYTRDVAPESASTASFEHIASRVSSAPATPNRSAPAGSPSRSGSSGPAPAATASASASASATDTRPSRNGYVTVLLWLAAIAGAIYVTNSLTSDSSALSKIGASLVGIAVIAAASWALYCRSVDVRAQDQWSRDEEERHRLAGLLTPADSLVLAGMQPGPPPEPKRRHWGVVASSLGALTMAGVVIGAAGAPPATAHEPTPTMTVTESTTVTTTRSSTTSSTSSSSSTSTSEPTESAAVGYPSDGADRTAEPNAPRAAYVPTPGRTTTPAYTPTYTPRETYTPPANTGGGPFPNCSAARAAGAAPVYIGSPGYGPHLDRDGDGVGCE